MNKCKWNKGEFVPCEYAREFGSQAMDGSPKAFYFCPFCGASLAKPEEKKNDLPWWLVAGIRVEENIERLKDEILNLENQISSLEEQLEEATREDTE